ncbi:MAG TPA: 50S ribosomal protein L3 [Candidatus Binataceae bacterium]
MLSGLIGKKLGMTAFADATGTLRAATVVALGPCQVTQVKTAATDGYEAIQVTFGRRKHSRVRAPQRGHFAKSGTAPGVATREFRAADSAEIKLGQAVGVGDVFKPGDMVDVAGVSKGRGYAGVIKRHHFSGFPGSHGTHEYFRHGGSIGNRSYPGRVFKGLRMAGQLGNEAVTVPNLEVLQVMPEDHAIVIAGALPGAKGGIVIVRHAAKHRRTEAERGAANA